MFITPILNHPFQFSLPPKRPPAFSWIRFHAPGGRGEVLWGAFMRANLAAVAVQLSAVIYLNSIWRPASPSPRETTRADGHMSLGMRR